MKGIDEFLEMIDRWSPMPPPSPNHKKSWGEVLLKNAKWISLILFIIAIYKIWLKKYII